MEEMPKLNYEEFATKLCGSIHGPLLIAITGVSGIGKSSLAQLMSEKMGISSCVICADDFLRRVYHGEKNFRNNTNELLCPEMFDWEMLSGVIVSLRSNNVVKIPHYYHGYGWESEITVNPSDVIIVEGLFLDSENCNNYIEFDMYIVMLSDEDIIRKFRMKRDDYYRNHSRSFFRTKEQTESEIRRCILVNKLYERNTRINNVIKLFVHDGFLVSEIH